MANEFLTLQSIARQALPRLTENLVFPNLIHKDFSEDFRNLGDTIRVRKPVILTAEEFDQQNGVNYQDMKEQAVNVTLDKIATVDVEATAVEMATNVDDLNRLFVEPACVALAEKINNDGLMLYRDIPSFVGTAGTTPSTINILAETRKQLNLQKVPVQGRNALFDPEADAGLSTVEAIVHAEKSGSVKALREGAIGRVMGMDNYMSQAVKKHETGIATATSLKVNGVVAEGATTLNIDGTALTGNFKKGDVLKIGKGRYAVTMDSDVATANAISGVCVFPALPQLADNTAITLLENHTANLAFHPMAFAFVTRPLHNPNGEGVASYVTSFNGISLRITKGYDQKFKKAIYSMDVLYGYQCIYPQLACRILG